MKLKKIEQAGKLGAQLLLQLKLNLNDGNTNLEKEMRSWGGFHKSWAQGAKHRDTLCAQTQILHPLGVYHKNEIALESENKLEKDIGKC